MHAPKSVFVIWLVTFRFPLIRVNWFIRCFKKNRIDKYEFRFTYSSACWLEMSNVIQKSSSSVALNCVHFKLISIHSRSEKKWTKEKLTEDGINKKCYKNAHFHFLDTFFFLGFNLFKWFGCLLWWKSFCSFLCLHKRTHRIIGRSHHFKEMLILWMICSFKMIASHHFKWDSVSVQCSFVRHD